MKIRARFFWGLALIAGGFGQAQALDYSSLYVFGDSLVDSGNAYLGSAGAEADPADGYYFGRFSNGPNFADYLAQSLNVAVPLPLLAGGTNVAVGGALAQSLPGETSPSFRAQIDYYKALYGQPIASDALVLVTFGGNDVRATSLIGGAVDFSAAASDLQTGLAELYGLGARNFLITGVADIGLLPSEQPLAGIPGRLAELTQRSEQFSDLLEDEAALLDSQDGTTVSFFDLLGFEHALLADPAAYGLPATLDATTPCQIEGGGSPQVLNCLNSLYFDGIHPTTQVHLAIADAMAAQLAAEAVPEPAMWAALVLGFGLVGSALRGRRASAGRLALA